MNLGKIRLNTDKLKEIIFVKEGSLIFLFNDNLEPIDYDEIELKNINLYDKVKEFEKRTGIKIDLTHAIIENNPIKRKYIITKLLGKAFEDYLFSILSTYYNIERNKEIFPSIYKFTRTRYHNKPDFIIENKVIVEAKLSYVNFRQIEEYSRIYKHGIIAFPWSGECRVPKGWSCNFYTIYDVNRLINKIGFYLNK